ncbi:hypothetical protein VDGE_30596 [Verticillium dahliae]|uniref:NB-ARC domain-containing protein n=1 Tax=Verticillium dahliae TaxID=27337 RepID=A0A444RLC6_VERDA|nr:hypothetical protein VDGE_30596 [Verticillium dahliae]
MPCQLADYRILCKTLNTPVVDVAKQQNFQVVVKDLKTGDDYYDPEDWMLITGSKAGARNAPFPLLYLFLVGEFESPVKDDSVAYNAIRLRDEQGNHRPRLPDELPLRLTHLLDCTTVREACRAIPAATTFFDTVAIGIWVTLKELVTETEKTAEQFRRDKADLDDDSRYFHFDVILGLKDIGLEESKKQVEIAAVKGRYVALQDVLKHMRACAHGVARRQYLGPYKTRFSLQGVPVSAKFVNKPSDTARLEECHLPWKPHREGRRVFVLHGLGGVSKTQPAVNFARHHQAAFSSVFWLDGGSEDRLRQIIARCIDRIPEGQIPSASQQQAGVRSNEHLDAAVACVMSWLGRPDNRDWLLVFDNVDLDHEENGVAGTSYVKRYIPRDLGSVLVTTRVSRLAQLGDSCQLAKVYSSLGGAILKAWYGRELGERLQFH